MKDIEVNRCVISRKEIRSGIVRALLDKGFKGQDTLVLGVRSIRVSGSITRVPYKDGYKYKQVLVSE